MTGPRETGGRAARREGAHAPTTSAEDELRDDDLRAEIELLAEVMALVGRRRRRLAQAEIDRVLGIRR
jgi:hypothetical protein